MFLKCEHLLSVLILLRKRMLIPYIETFLLSSPCKICCHFFAKEMLTVKGTAYTVACPL